jgi:hypothetical protein
MSGSTTNSESSRDNPPGVGVKVSDAETMLVWLEGERAAAA